MSTKIAHLEDGTFVMLSDDDQPVMTVTPTNPQPAGTAPQPGGVVVAPGLAADTETDPIEIYLKPIKRRPRPMGIIFTPNPPRDQIPGQEVPSIDLVKSAKDGEFTDSAVSELKKHALKLQHGEHLLVDAFIPPGHSVDLARLSQHAAALGEKISRPVQFRLGTTNHGG